MLINRRRWLALAASLPLGLASRARAEPDDVRPFEAALEEVFAAYGPVGLGALVIQSGETDWSGVRGLRRFGQPDSVTADDRWHLGSNTKAMTAAVWARLIVRRRARWGMPVTEVFADLAVDEGWRDARIDDFIHHRAGLTDAAVMGRAWLASARTDPRTLVEQRAAIVAEALRVPPSLPRGQFAYGNANYVVLGAAIERLTGEPWEQVMRAELFAPLALTSAGFGAPGAGLDNAWGHRGAQDQRRPMPPGHPGADNPAALGPAGTVHMSLPDYGRFLLAVMGDAPGWLEGPSLRRLAAPAEGPEPAYAAGWGVRNQPWGAPAGPGLVLSHDGSNTMWHCSAAIAPARGLGVVAVANEGAAGGPACQALIRRLVEARPSS